MRLEHDLLGEREVPDEVYYGIHTLRAIENFPITGRPIHKELIKALVVVKKAAAATNMETGQLDKNKAEAIIKACNEILDGKYMDQFVVDAIQGGAGTSSNMNANEVIANIAIEVLGGKRGDYSIIHPINDVNMCQSTNDVYPTALRVAAIKMLIPVSEMFAELQEALQEKESEFSGILKMGRTQLQDAVPIMLGQEFGAFAQAIARDRWRIYKVEERLRQINMGGTAVGTGLNATIKYIYMITEKLREFTGIGLARAEYMIDITQNADVFVEVSGLLKSSAVNLTKIANDLRLMSSGPKTGFGEINLPPMQAGSSIMPGKVNPIMPEVINQIAFQVMSNDLAITLASQAGQLELNVMLPLVAYNLLEALEILNNGIKVFIEKCIKGITVDKERCRSLVEESYGLITALTHYIGYENASVAAQKSMHENKTIREVVKEMGLLDDEQLEKILNPFEMTKPGIPGKGK